MGCIFSLFSILHKKAPVALAFDELTIPLEPWRQYENLSLTRSLCPFTYQLHQYFKGTTYSWILSGQHISHGSAFGKRGGHSLLWWLGMLIWGKWSWCGKHWSRYRLWLKSLIRWMAGCLQKVVLASTLILVVCIIVVIKSSWPVREIHFWFYIKYHLYSIPVTFCL